MKDKVHVLFVCGYGVGSSAISESIVKKALVAEGINAEVKHTAVGEMPSMKDWTDIIAISTKLAEGVTFQPEEHVIKSRKILWMVKVLRLPLVRSLMNTSLMPE